MGQAGGIVDYSKKKEVQLNEEMESSQQKIAGLERAQAERKRAEEAGEKFVLKLQDALAKVKTLNSEA